MTQSDLLSACQVLFGARRAPDPGLLARLDVATVRRIFRQRALDLHPDRAGVLGRSPLTLADAFKEVEAAQRLLLAHLKGVKRIEPETPHPPAAARPSPPPRPAPRPARAADEVRPRARPPVEPVNHYWQAGLPARTLRFGEYLYYSGRIPWRQLIRALVWQAGQQPRFGQIATNHGYLSPDALREAMSRRRPSERVGEAALRLRLLTELQQEAVLLAQRRSRRRIGDYFLESGGLRPADLEELGRTFRAHNARVALARSPAP